MHSFHFYGISTVENGKDALLPEFSSFIIDYMFHGNPVGTKTWCHIFISLFSISKEKAVVNSNFPAGRGKGELFMCVEEWHPPSHLRTVPPRNTCLLQLKPVQKESWGSEACSSNVPPFYNIYSPPV